MHGDFFLSSTPGLHSHAERGNEKDPCIWLLPVLCDTVVLRICKEINFPKQALLPVIPTSMTLRESETRTVQGLPRSFGSNRVLRGIFKVRAAL
jgi:hypothetical protein